MTRKNTFLILLSAFLLFTATIITIYDQWQLSLQRAATRPAELTAKGLLHTAFKKFNVPNNGIIHIGAHNAEELETYKELNVSNILWIEADPDLEAELINRTKNDPHSQIAIFAASDHSGEAKFFVASNKGASSSMLKLKNHLLRFPSITTTKEITVQQERLDDYLDQHPDLKNTNYNLIAIDIQGAEKIALMGATKTLQNIDAILAEVNYEELYENAVLINELDQFLQAYDFVRVDTRSYTASFGDALYVKNKFCARCDATPKKIYHTSKISEPDTLQTNKL